MGGSIEKEAVCVEPIWILPVRVVYKTHPENNSLIKAQLQHSKSRCMKDAERMGMYPLSISKEGHL